MIAISIHCNKGSEQRKKMLSQKRTVNKKERERGREKKAEIG
jgi:hypothetical protein